MATDVILPALGMAQETGRIIEWLKAEGAQVKQGEPLAAIETDKATVEIEAPANGVLARVLFDAGAEVPVGQVIATILSANEAAQEHTPHATEQQQPASTNAAHPQVVTASPLASRIAAEHQVDLRQVKLTGQRVKKADVLAYLQNQSKPSPNRLSMASPKARRIAREQGIDISAIHGSGPEGAVLTADVLALPQAAGKDDVKERLPVTPLPLADEEGILEVSNTWRLMAQRTAQSWTSVPHFALVREVNASRLLAWRAHLLKRGLSGVTYTDLLVKIAATALRAYPRVNATRTNETITLHTAIHVGIAVAVEDGAVVALFHHADTLSIDEIVRRREELVDRARNKRLRPEDIRGGTFTISNLGMYGVDAFNAIINTPQAAILAVGRIVERVVPLNGQPVVQPMMILTLSCDHLALDGARGAQFLSTLAHLIEEPLGLLDHVEQVRRENATQILGNG